MEKTLSTENKHNPPPITSPVQDGVQTPSGEQESILTEYLKGKVDCLDIGLLEFPEMPWTNTHILEDRTGLS